MASFRRLKTYFKFYNRLSKTTKAIKLVTLSKLQMLQSTLHTRRFSLVYARDLFKLKTSLPSNEFHLLIPITSEISCPGPIDQILANYTFKVINLLRANGDNYGFFFLGRRGLYLFKEYKTKKAYKGFIYNVNKQPISLLVVSDILKHIMSIPADKYQIIFNRYYNVFTQIPHSYEITAFKHLFDALNGSYPLDFNSYATRNLVRKRANLYKLYEYNFALVLYNALRDHFVSELGGRVAAMDASIKNLDEILLQVRIDYQKARQNAITNELIEIISCLNVLISNTGAKSTKKFSILSNTNV
jgi:F-type H+-transporting ATPase subunit gamma